MKKFFSESPNVKILQDNFGLTKKEAKHADALLRQYISHSGENETALISDVSKIIAQDVASDSTEQWDDACQRVLNHYSSKNNSWMWGENLFCIVAYIYTYCLFFFF